MQQVDGPGTHSSELRVTRTAHTHMNSKSPNPGMGDPTQKS